MESQWGLILRWTTPLSTMSQETLMDNTNVLYVWETTALWFILKNHRQTEKCIASGNVLSSHHQLSEKCPLAQNPYVFFYRAADDHTGNIKMLIKQIIKGLKCHRAVSVNYNQHFVLKQRNVLLDIFISSGSFSFDIDKFLCSWINLFR